MNEDDILDGDHSYLINRSDMLTQLRKSCLLNIKSSRLISCLSLSTMILLVFASIVIMTIISVTPIIILGIGELPSGQRDIIITPRVDFINSTKLEQISQLSVMPRSKLFMSLNNANFVTVWLMDFQKERDNHLGTIGGGEGPNHNFIYAHEDVRIGVDQEVQLNLMDNKILIKLKTMIEKDML